MDGKNRKRGRKRGGTSEMSVGMRSRLDGAGIARLALRPYQGQVRRAPWNCAVLTSLSNNTRCGRDAPDFAFDHQSTDLRGAALSRAAQGQSPRPCVAI